MIDPPRWTEDELNEARGRAIERFRRDRIDEPLEAYLDAFDTYDEVVKDLFTKTSDLTDLQSNALEILTSAPLSEAFRYLLGPPISADDLAVTADALLTAKQLTENPQMVSRIVDVVRTGLDRRRFPWIATGRGVKEDEKKTAIAATAALMAMRKRETARRGKGGREQELEVETALITAGFQKVHTRKVETLADAPAAGEFCRESYLGSRKADFLVGLWDRRIMPIECKASNSATNSVKRLNNDAAQKAVVWQKDFGPRNVVPVAVLSGVYKLRNLLDAQERGLTLFWAHDLHDLMGWIKQTSIK